jgi:hypothetical protein
MNGITNFIPDITPYIVLAILLVAAWFIDKYSQFWTSFCIFAVLGAPIGWIGLFIGVFGGITDYSIFFFGIYMSYLEGGIPAVIAGMLFGIIISKKRLSAPLGAVVGFIAGVVSTSGYCLFSSYTLEPNIIMIVGPGGFAGAVCGYLASWIINRKTRLRPLSHPAGQKVQAAMDQGLT